MIFEHQTTLPTNVTNAWELLMQVPEIGACIPGVQNVEQLDADTYRSTMTLKIGAIRLNFEGTIVVVERDRDGLRARLEAQGADRRVGGSVRAAIEMSLVARSEAEIELHIRTDAAIMGKLGEMGQAVVRKKADQIMLGFAENVTARVSGGSISSPAD